MFKIGDKVRVKLNLEVDKPYNGCYFKSKMKVYKGKTGTIVSAHGDRYENSRYRLDIDDSYYYSNDMLDPITLPYKIGDRIRIINKIPEDKYGIGGDTWLQILGKPGKIIDMNSNNDSYLVSIPETSIPFWFPSKYLKKEPTLISKNSTENVSKLIEYVPEIELSYCKKQIYTI